MREPALTKKSSVHVFIQIHIDKFSWKRMKLSITNSDLTLDLKKHLGQHLFITPCAYHRTLIAKEPSFSKFRGGYLTFNLSNTSETFTARCSAFPTGAGGSLPTNSVL